VCENYTKGDNPSLSTQPVKLRAVDREITPLPTGIPPSIIDRKISKNAVRQYKVTVEDDKHIYPYFNNKGEHVSNKVRIVENKEFYCEGDVKSSILFGQQAFPQGGLAITITEGELDAMAAYDMFGNRYPCVSVRSSSEAKKNCADQIDYLNSFKSVVIAFDNDDAGQKAARQVAELFEPGKAKILKLHKHKDASDYLKNNDHHAFTKEWHNAKPFTPDGLKIGKDMWDEIVNHSVPESVPYPFEGLNYHTYGMRLSELVVVTAETGVGKTSVLKEIEYNLLTNPLLKEKEAGVGFLHLEEPNYDTAIGLMGIHNSKPYHLPDTERTQEELREAYDAVLNNDRVVIYDAFGSNSVDVIVARVRHMAALGCQYIVLDHLSIVVSDQSGDERKQLDEITTKLKMLAMEKNIHLTCVIHVNRAGQIRGTAGVEQLANIVIRLKRDKTSEDAWRRNITEVSVEKNRFCGRTGPSCMLRYDEFTGRLIELTKDEEEKFREGGTGRNEPF
jgi:twinkle protein